MAACEANGNLSFVSRAPPETHAKSGAVKMVANEA